jgi:hypothetical protein
VLRERPQSVREQAGAPQRAAATAVPDEDGVADEVAAAELEDPRALAEQDEQKEAAQAEETEPEETATENTVTTPGKVDPVDGACPASHPIKGNHSSSGDFIYHVPGSRNYDRTTPDACFATEADAEAAGFRAPRG